MAAQLNKGALNDLQKKKKTNKNAKPQYITPAYNEE